MSLNKRIISCKKCPRLVKFREKIATEKRKQYIEEDYWGKPITGFGDLKAKTIIIGLAPAAHGGNRTGRVFTGDRSAEFLYRCLYKKGISNLSNSLHINDGLKLKNTFITTALKCVPPGDKPTSKELFNCFNFFDEEIQSLKNSRKIIALGKIAFDACIKYYKKKYPNDLKKYSFAHGTSFKMPDGKELYGCYHPSPRNVNTGRIDEKKMIKFLDLVYGN
jgi:uracil-DNA glycosylase family 4|tara:strand:- start:47 stop:706 length:660 start_codon:yes stop_codon:yes gene_type:complete